MKRQDEQAILNSLFKGKNDSFPLGPSDLTDTKKIVPWECSCGSIIEELNPGKILPIEIYDMIFNFIDNEAQCGLCRLIELLKSIIKSPLNIPVNLEGDTTSIVDYLIE